MPNREQRFLSLSLNPAWQKTVFFPVLTLGAVNRAEWLRESGGGKGTNFARALRLLNGDVTIAQFAGGSTGELLCREFDAAGIPHLTAPTAAKTRICTTVLNGADGSATELIEPSAQLTDADVQALHGMVLGRLSEFSGVALCGTFPAGVPAAFYADVAAAARPSALVRLDAVRSVEPTLRVGVDVLKINARELLALSPGPDVRSAAQRCLANYPVECLAVTAGAEPALLFHRRKAWEFTLPALAGFRNAIGAGDCAAAVLLHYLVGESVVAKARGAAVPGARLDPEQLVEGFARALAHACASCLDPLPAVFDPANARRLRSQVNVRELPEPG